MHIFTKGSSLRVCADVNYFGVCVINRPTASTIVMSIDKEK